MNERTELIGGIPFSKGEYAHIRKHIGEQIAQEIEKMEPKAADFIDTLKGKYWVARCASIARGEK